jgi:nascent polypeptide-associated complex subunit alpha
MKELKTENIDAKRVIIETTTGKIIIEEPKVTTIEFQGQKTYTILGNEKVVKGEEASEANEEDIALVQEKTGKSYEEAKEALEKANNDIALAIKMLTEG